MKKYIGFKMISAKEMEKHLATNSDCVEGIKGYKVVYEGGYESWSPKEVFEKAYMEVGENNSITKENVDNFIKEIEVMTMGEKTTVVKVTLINGFEIVESSSCVDPSNYDEELGKEICLGRIKNKIWELLGFLLQTAKEGIK